jgi:hypothetical protein
MNITTQIECDCKSLEAYFHKLFILYDETLAEQKQAPMEVYSDDSQLLHARFHSFSHLIKPDMLMNIYSLIDYWLVVLCEHYKVRLNLKLSRGDINADSDLARAHKYLKSYASLDLSAALNSYEMLNKLRKVRNAFMHGGGHIKPEKVAEFSNIKGVSLFGSLLVIERDFIWDSLSHTKNYLLTLAEATPPAPNNTA